jgi:hypothetical protein
MARFDRSHRRSAVLVIVLMLAATGIAGGLADSPVGRHPAGKDIIESLSLVGADRDAVRTRIVEVAGMPFERALEIEVTRTPGFPNSAALSRQTAEPIRAGDVVLFSLRMKCLETDNDTGQGLIGVSLGGVWPNTVLRTEFSSEGEWVQRWVRGRAAADLPVGEGELVLSLGYRPQKIVVADIRLVNFGHTAAIDDLPMMPASYPGMEPDAPWREQAAARIERYRKSDLELVVVDREGNPVTAATVGARLTRHTFGFGCIYPARLYRDQIFDAAELEIFHRHFKRLFNKAVLPDSLKWKNFERVGRVYAPTAVRWLEQNGIRVRGHVLVWPGWRCGSTRTIPRPCAG